MITSFDVLAGPADEVRRLLAHEHHDPHSILGAHWADVAGQRAVVVRAYHPEAVAARALVEGRKKPIPLNPTGAHGLFAGVVDNAAVPLVYRTCFEFANGDKLERDDPYRFGPTVGEIDLHLFNEGTHRRIHKVLGAHRRNLGGIDGVSFAVWAPNAKRVSVVGDWNFWDGRVHMMRSMGNSGVWELFIPNVPDGQHYKYEILTQSNDIKLKADPYARSAERPPGTASCVFTSSYIWGDDAYMHERARRDTARSPIAIYELHLSSWKRKPEEGNRPLTYREAAHEVVDHVKKLGFNYIEPLPLAEYPFEGSWGYQVSGYFAPTSRFGNPDDFKYFVDVCHQNGIGVILDIVPAHFPKDDFSLGRFDGTPLYEHADPRKGEHPDWGTYIFNYGRNEVRAFLICNALYWLRDFHLDGLRIDAVASMLYLDYSRKAGEWVPNQYGGNENLEAISLIKSMNAAVREECPGCLMVAEESTAFGGVTAPPEWGGLGFHFKWNMGWMHDTLLYFSKDPIHRQYHHNDLTFAMIYEYSERFIMPLSHDEVVHGKRHLLDKMPGDVWQKFANLRCLLSYQFLRPGKKLLFQGSELAPWEEWNYAESLPWHLLDDPDRQKFLRFVESLGAFYQNNQALWYQDHEASGAGWIDCSDWQNSVIGMVRRGGDQRLYCIYNLTPVPRDGYRIGVPEEGEYRVVFNSDSPAFGGSGYASRERYPAERVEMHGCGWSLNLSIPPLAVVVLERVG